MSFVLPDLDRETIDELILSIQEALDEVEPALTSLSADPNQPDLLNDLFRHLHTIKGNFRMCFLDPFTDYVHEIEELVSEFRKGRLQCTTVLKDAVLFGLDRLRDYMEQISSEGECPTEDMKRYGEYFEQLAAAEPADADALATRLFRLGTTNVGTTDSEATHSDDHDTVVFFKQAALKLDQRLPHRAGRTELLEALASDILQHLPDPLDGEQFYVALYLHDIGLPIAAGKGAAVDPLAHGNAALQKHPLLSQQYLAKHPQFAEAATMVAQHHETLDGTGYPNGLSADSIHPGAKLLCVLSNFYDLMQQKPDASERRAVLNALMEMNSQCEVLYDSGLVTLLTEAVGRHYGH